MGCGIVSRHRPKFEKFGTEIIPANGGRRNASDGLCGDTTMSMTLPFVGVGCPAGEEYALKTSREGCVDQLTEPGGRRQRMPARHWHRTLIPQRASTA